MTWSDSQRLQLARAALVKTGYFTADQVGADIAPRITEMHSVMAAEVASLREQVTDLSSQYCPRCHETRPCIHNIAPELFCSCGCGNPVGHS